MARLVSAIRTSVKSRFRIWIEGKVVLWLQATELFPRSILLHSYFPGIRMWSASVWPFAVFTATSSFLPVVVVISFVSFLSCLKIGSLKFLNGHIPVFFFISISRMSQKKSFECHGGAPNTDLISWHFLLSYHCIYSLQIPYLSRVVDVRIVVHFKILHNFLWCTALCA